MLSLEYLSLVTSIPFVSLMHGNIVSETQALNRVSGHEMRIERDEKVGPKENGVFITRVTQEANLSPYVEEKLGNLCCACPQ